MTAVNRVKLRRLRATRPGMAGTASRYRKLRVESLEGRWLLSATTWMSNSWDFVTDTDSSGSLTQGDEIAWEGVTAFYGVTGFGKVTTGEYTGEIDGFKQLQDAIDNTAAGGTLHVLPGLYEPAETLQISETLTLLGPQAGVDPRASQNSSRLPNDETTEAILAGNGLATILQIAADDVQVNGLSFRDSSDADFDIWMEEEFEDWFADAMQDPFLSIPGMIQSSLSTPIQNPRVTHNLIYNGREHRGIRLRGVSDARIESNQISNTVGNAINLVGSLRGEIRDNEVFGNWSPDAAVYVYGSMHTQIVGNRVSEVHVNDGIKLGSKAGVDVSLTGGVIADNVIHDVEQDGITIYTSDVEVRGNWISHSRSENGAIYVQFAVDDVTIVDNDILHNEAPGVAIGRQGSGPIFVAVLGNRIRHNDVGVVVDGSMSLVEGNDLTDNFVGLLVRNGSLVDAGSKSTHPTGRDVGSRVNGASWGANLLTGYSGADGNLAIRNENLIAPGHPPLNASNNMFGTVNLGEIAAVVYDASDDARLTVVNLAPPAPLVTIRNNSNGLVWEGYKDFANWRTGGNGFGGHNRFVLAGDGSQVATWRFPGVADGLYRLSATWFPWENRATNSPFTVFDRHSAFATLLVNQQLAPGDLNDAGAAWDDLGLFPVTSGELRVQLTNLADPGKYVIADAMRLERIGDLPDEPGSVMLIDNGEPGYSETGDWVTAGQGYNGDSRFRMAGSGNNLATWTFADLQEGLYQVAATWVPAPNRATNSPFTVSDGIATSQRMAVNQRLAPADFEADGAWWEILGGVYPITLGTLEVQLSDAANGAVVADAVRIQRVGDLPGLPVVSPPIIANGDPGYREIGNWSQGTRGFNGDNRFSEPGSGESRALWLFEGVAEGLYRVSATWYAHANRASNAPFRVSDGTTVLGTHLVDQRESPADRFADGADWMDLGGLFPISSGVLSVGLTNAADGFVIADAIRIERVGDLPSSPPGPEDLILDNSDPEYADSGAWTTGAQGYQADNRFSAAGSGSDVAEWTFASLPTGLYRVSGTWFAHPNRATNAPFTLFDGALALSTLAVNQRKTPADFTADGTGWQVFGGLYPVTAGELRVQLSDAANGYVIADALRVERVGDLLMPLGLTPGNATFQVAAPVPRAGLPLSVAPAPVFAEPAPQREPREVWPSEEAGRANENARERPVVEHGGVDELFGENQLLEQLLDTELLANLV